MEDWEIERFIKMSKVRQKILKSLNKPKTATDIAKELKVYRETVSRALIEMQDKGIVQCINPKAPNYRYYQKTIK